MTLFDSHLEQVSLSAQSIAELQFPPPGIFTNALLGNHEITTLIRDTEPHERALFILDPASVNNASSNVLKQQSRADHGTTRKSTYGHFQDQRQSAVARVLGPDMLRQIRQSNSSVTRTKGIDVEVLLQSAERLCSVYPVDGAPEKVMALRNRHNQIASSIETYEERVQKQQAKLNRLHKGSTVGAGSGDEGLDNLPTTQSAKAVVSEVDFVAEEHEIRDLEVRKRALEERVSEMERDLGGLRH